MKKRREMWFIHFVGYDKRCDQLCPNTGFKKQVGRLSCTCLKLHKLDNIFMVPPARTSEVMPVGSPPLRLELELGVCLNWSCLVCVHSPQDVLWLSPWRRPCLMKKLRNLARTMMTSLLMSSPSMTSDLQRAPALHSDCKHDGPAACDQVFTGFSCWMSFYLVLIFVVLNVKHVDLCRL